ncbi:MAG: hypothetical protein KF805_11285 [Phycisphaeraceae bacterium]|nr:hypothetical protein [Phycisphaeraceae bacterium]
MISRRTSRLWASGRNWVGAALGVLLALLPAGLARAQTLTWTGAANGTTFNLAGNWSPAELPGPGHDCVIPAGAGTISVGTVSVKSITTARNLLLDGCDTVTLTGGIQLQSGAIVQIDNTGGCTGLIFSGGTQSISGSGSIFISSEGIGGIAISVKNGCSLGIEADVAVTYGAGGTGSAAAIRIESGATLNSSGTIGVDQVGRTLNINGPGTFSNGGTLHAAAGTLALSPAVWSSTGQIEVGAGAVVTLAGAFSSLGSIVNSGGSVIVSGAGTGATISASALSGVITIQNAVLTNCTLVSADGTGFALAGSSTFSGCTIGANVTGACVFITIQNGLTFANGAILSAGVRCDSAKITIAGGTQLITGNGQIRLHSSGSNSGNGALVISQSASVTFGPDISIVAPTSDPWTNLQILSGGSLVNNGTISVSAKEFNIDVRDASAHFTNNGTIELLSGSSASAIGSAWINAGTISCTGAKFTFDSSWINDGSISAAASATLLFRGSEGTNNGVIDVTNSTASIWASTWTNASQITSTSSSLEFRGNWSNAGVITSIDSAAMLAGTFSSLGTFVGSGGTTTLAQGTYTGATLVATAQTGDLILSSIFMSGTTLSTQGANFIVTSPKLANCTIASDLLVTTDREITVTGNLTLANNAIITLGSPVAGGNADGLFFTGGTQALLGAGTILARYCPSLFTFNTATSLTLGPGITLSLGPNANAGTFAQIPIPAGSTLTNQGTISVAQAGCKLQIYQSGTFRNEGILDVIAGTLDIDSLSGPVGIAQVASGGSLQIQGNFTIDQPINSQGSLAFAGTWTNNSSVSVTGGSFSTSGTWVNAGSISLQSSPWIISGNYSSLGNITTTSSPRTFFGTVPAGMSVRADASSGDVFLDRVSFTNSTLRAEDGTVFRIATGSGQFLNLNGCTLAGTLLAGTCCDITLTNGLTLSDGAELSLESGASCGPAVLYVASGTQSIAGSGKISFRNLDVATGSIQLLSNASLTVASGVSLICPTNSRLGGRITLASFSTMTNFGIISMQMPATTLSVGGSGSFLNSGTIESIAGSLSINPTTLQNYNAATFSLSGGTWIAKGGSLTLGSRVIRTLGPGAVMIIASPVGAIPTINTLTTIDGTLRIAANTLTTTPVGGTLTNNGTIDLAADGVFAITGALVLNPAGTVRTEIKGVNVAQFGRIKPTTASSVAGHLRGTFIPPYSPAAGTIFTPFIFGNPITGAFSDICFDASPQNMGITQNIFVSALRLVASTASGTSPAITQQPESTSANPDAVFTLLAAPGDAAYQWRKNGNPLSDGPTPSGSTITGSQTKTLTIHNSHPADAGSYDAMVSNSCGSTISDAATLSVCAGDLNGDGLVDDADFVLFLAGYNILDCADPSMPPGCPADLNSDGLVDDTDFQIFVPAYDVLLCP